MDDTGTKTPLMKRMRKAAGLWRRMLAKIRHATGDPGLDEPTYHDVVCELYNSPASLAAGVIGGSWVAYACYALTGSATYLWFMAAMLGWGALRHLTEVAQRRERADGRYLPRTRTAFWEATYIGAGWIYSSIFGALGYHALTTNDDAVVHMIVIVAGIGYSAGVSARNAARLLLVAGQIVCNILPLVVGLALTDSEGRHHLAFLIILLFTSILMISVKVGRIAIKSAHAVRQFERLAKTDTLTGLPNRLWFMERLNAVLEADRGTTSKTHVFYMDLDGFKTINDTLGHDIGDKLLCEVSARLVKTMPAGGKFARLGGDEFVAMAKGDDAEIAEKILSAIAQPFKLGKDLVRTGASIGISASRPGGDVSAHELMKRADMALYAAKESGKGRYVRYGDEMGRAVSRRSRLTDWLATAIEDGGLEMHYQPIVDLRTGLVSSYEALMRWTTPDGDVITPSEFIPLAEQSGAIRKLGRWALETACADAATWPDGASVAVNLSAIQLGDCDALKRAVTVALMKASLVPSRLELEITESVLIKNQEQTSRFIKEVTDFGIRVNMDDFGTGYSSLIYLRDLPFAKIKVDRSFATTLETDPRSHAIVQAIVRLASDLKSTVVIEGIENESQMRCAAEMGIAYAQGYHFGRPRPKRDLTSEASGKAAAPTAVNG